ncbi:ArsB/NhaD family transporter [bacterium]|nr:ArsB/NhaD family transporter [Verrucomicrobiota bacterium]MDC0267831.1 ArsB/NhaD family transporter [bacterium]MDG1893220.1 ArsB/NhaD family transporter [Verrucomicrobiota bacterium]
MSKTSKKTAGKKLHNPLHVTIAVGLVTLICALMLHQGTETKYVFGFLLAMTLGMLALEKINKAILVLLGSGIALLLAIWRGVLEKPDDHGAHALPVYIEMIDWGTIGIIIGSTIFVELISRSGLFAWISVKILKVSQGDPFKLLICFSGLTVIFSAFLNNVTAMIIVGSLTIVACKKLKLSAMPFLLAEGIYTNIGGLLTLISSIPNIIVGTAARIGYADFLVVTGPYCLIAFVATLYLVRWIFKLAPLVSAQGKADAKAMVDAFDEWDTVKDKKFFYLSALVLGAIILGFALHASIPVLNQMGLEVIAILGATVMLVIYPTDVEGVLNEVEWTLVLFFVGLFTLLGVMEHAGVLAMIGDWLKYPLSSGPATGPIAMMWSSAFFSGLTDNIPLAAVLAKVLSGFQSQVTELSWFAEYGHMLWWSLIFGAGLGGNFTPIGSASTVVAIGILKKEGHPITFMQYVKIGAIVVLVQLLLATGYLFGAEKIGLIKPLDHGKVPTMETQDHKASDNH